MGNISRLAFIFLCTTMMTGCSSSIFSFLFEQNNLFTKIRSSGQSKAYARQGLLVVARVTTSNNSNHKVNLLLTPGQADAVNLDKVEKPVEENTHALVLGSTQSDGRVLADEVATSISLAPYGDREFKCTFSFAYPEGTNIPGDEFDSPWLPLVGIYADTSPNLEEAVKSSCSALAQELLYGEVLDPNGKANPNAIHYSGSVRDSGNPASESPFDFYDHLVCDDCSLEENDDPNWEATLYDEATCYFQGGTRYYGEANSSDLLDWKPVNFNTALEIATAAQQCVGSSAAQAFEALLKEQCAVQAAQGQPVSFIYYKTFLLMRNSQDPNGMELEQPAPGSYIQCESNPGYVSISRNRCKKGECPNLHAKVSLGNNCTSGKLTIENEGRTVKTQNINSGSHRIDLSDLDVGPHRVALECSGSGKMIAEDHVTIQSSNYRVYPGECYWWAATPFGPGDQKDFVGYFPNSEAGTRALQDACDRHGQTLANLYAQQVLECRAVEGKRVSSEVEVTPIIEFGDNNSADLTTKTFYGDCVAQGCPAPAFQPPPADGGNCNLGYYFKDGCCKRTSCSGGIDRVLEGNGSCPLGSKSGRGHCCEETSDPSISAHGVCYQISVGSQTDGLVSVPQRNMSTENYWLGLIGLFEQKRAEYCEKNPGKKIKESFVGMFKRNYDGSCEQQALPIISDGVYSMNGTSTIHEMDYRCPPKPSDKKKKLKKASCKINIDDVETKGLEDNHLSTQFDLDRFTESCNKALLDKMKRQAGGCQEGNVRGFAMVIPKYDDQSTGKEIRYPKQGKISNPCEAPAPQNNSDSWDEVRCCIDSKNGYSCSNQPRNGVVHADTACQAWAIDEVSKLNCSDAGPEGFEVAYDTAKIFPDGHEEPGKRGTMTACTRDVEHYECVYLIEGQLAGNWPREFDGLSQARSAIFVQRDQQCAYAPGSSWSYTCEANYGRNFAQQVVESGSESCK